MCNTVYCGLGNNNVNRDVQEECANRLYRVCTHSSNTDDENSELAFTFNSGPCPMVRKCIKTKG